MVAAPGSAVAVTGVEPAASPSIWTGTAGSALDRDLAGLEVDEAVVA